MCGLFSSRTEKPKKWDSHTEEYQIYLVYREDGDVERIQAHRMNSMGSMVEFYKVNSMRLKTYSNIDNSWRGEDIELVTSISPSVIDHIDEGEVLSEDVFKGKDDGVYTPEEG